MPRQDQPALDAWYLFRLAKPLSEAQANSLRAFSGPKVNWKGNEVRTGLNCAWLAEAYLQSIGYKPGEAYRITAPNLDALRHKQFPRIEEFRTKVKGVERSFPEYLMPWQVHNVVNLGHLRGQSLWWPPGAGKTIAATLYGVQRPGLIVFGTRSGARYQVANEVRRYTHIEPEVLEGHKPHAIDPERRMVVIGWDVLTYWVDFLILARPITLIMDEVHRLKDHRRLIAVPKRDTDGRAIQNADGSVKLDFVARQNRAAAIMKLSRAAAFRISATGSPLSDGRVRDLYTQLDLVEPLEWGGSFYTFTRRYADAREGEWGGIDTRGRAAQPLINELNCRLSFSTHYVPAEVTRAHLPAKRREVVYVPKSELVREGKELEAALKEARTYLRTAAFMNKNAVIWAQLAATAVRKRPAVVAFVAERAQGNTKIVVTTGMVRDAEALALALRKALPDGYPLWFGTGETEARVREQTRLAYAGADRGVLVGTLAAWGESTDGLQSTDISVATMLPYTPAAIIQWEGRFSRTGQTRPNLNVYMVGEGTYDEVVAGILYEKFETVGMIAPATEMNGFGKQILGMGNEEALLDALVAKISEKYVLD